MTQQTLEKKVKKYIKEEEKLLKKSKLGRVPMILFKQKKVPLICKFATWILQKYKAQIDFQFFIND